MALPAILGGVAAAKEGAGVLKTIITRPIIGYKKHTTIRKKRITIEKESAIQLTGVEVLAGGLGAAALVAGMFALGAVRWREKTKTVTHQERVAGPPGPDGKYPTRTVTKKYSLGYWPSANPDFAGFNKDGPVSKQALGALTATSLPVIIGKQLFPDAPWP